MAFVALALGPAARGQGYTLWTLNGTPASSAGTAVAGVGDVNGDGFDDVLVGGPMTGVARAFSGATGVPLYTLTGPIWFGSSVAGVGDVDGDGAPDLIVGGPETANVARLFSGASGSLLFDLASPGGGDFGRSVAGVGDVSGDGIPDVAVGAPMANLVRIFSGATGALLSTITGPAGSWMFGRAVAGVGDVTGDGVPDILVGDPAFATLAGAARVFSGATGNLVPGLDLLGNPLQAFGSAVAGLGDVTGDGVPDFVVGAPTFPIGSPDVGQARAYSGATGALLYVLSAQFQGDEFGTSVAGVGDVNGDGVRDVVVGAPKTSSPTLLNSAGRATIYTGSTGAPIPGLTFSGAQAFDQLGRSVAAAGDVNGDGVPDAVLGAPQFALGPGPGFARVVAGVGLPPGTSAFGAGCSGSNGDVPGITTAGGNPSVLTGNPNFRLVLSKALPSAPAHLILGVSDTVWIATGIPLPLDLAPFGLPGCPLLVSVEFLFLAATNGDGIASVPMPVPSVPALVGGSVFFQGRIFDSTGAVTGALEVVL
jgi:FG-GAP repeat protein/VCBS repeat protein